MLNDCTFTASDFDGRMREQMPWYDLATRAVAHLARTYVCRGGQVYDIGASTGNVARALWPIVEARGGSITGIEISPTMVSYYSGPGQIAEGDAVSYPYVSFDLAVCFLTLSYIAPHSRGLLMERLYENCAPGGGVIVVDQCRGGLGYLQTVLQRLAVPGGRRETHGVQRPIDVLTFARYRPVEFFRYGEFAGWVVEKPEA